MAWLRLPVAGVELTVAMLFVAPIFLAAEVAFALGLRRDTQQEVEKLSHRHD